MFDAGLAWHVGARWQAFAKHFGDKPICRPADNFRRVKSGMRGVRFIERTAASSAGVEK